VVPVAIVVMEMEMSQKNLAAPDAPAVTEVKAANISYLNAYKS
jgi:hypothetical protein